MALSEKTLSAIKHLYTIKPLPFAIMNRASYEALCGCGGEMYTDGFEKWFLERHGFEKWFLERHAAKEETARYWERVKREVTKFSLDQAPTKEFSITPPFERLDHRLGFKQPL